MNKEFKRDLAGMFSLMERMEKHATLNEAEGNKKFYVNEAAGRGGAKLFVERFEEKDPDDPNKTGWHFRVGGLWKSDLESLGLDFTPITKKDDKPGKVEDTEFGYWDVGYYPTAESFIGEVVDFLTDFCKNDTNNQYVKQYLDELGNPNTWKTKSNTEQNKILKDIKDTSIAELKKDFMEMISSNNYSSFAASKLGSTIINLEREYGNRLSDNNILAIQRQAQLRGTNPTFVVSKSTWESWGRAVKDDARPYFIEANKVRPLSMQKAYEKGLAQGWDLTGKEDVKNMPSSQVRDKLRFNYEDDPNYGPSAVYDISDTVDVSGFDKFYNEMGLLNNLTGELNDLAKKDQEEYEKRKESAMSSEELKDYQEEKSQKVTMNLLGQAIANVCNKIYGVNKTYVPDSLQSYIDLIKTVVKYGITATKDANKDVILSWVSVIVARRLGGYGAQELWQQFERMGAFGRNGDAQQYSTVIIGLSKSLVETIKAEYLELEKDWVAKNSKSASDQIATPQGGDDSTDGTQSYSPVAEAVFKKMEKLMKDPIIVDGKTLF